MEMIFEKCGPEVPAVNIHTRLMRNRHRNAARIQACFKGSLIRCWVRVTESQIWSALNDFVKSEIFDIMRGGGVIDPDLIPMGGVGRWPNSTVKIQTLRPECSGGRPFAGGLSVSFMLAPDFYFHTTIPRDSYFVTSSFCSLGPLVG